MRSLKVGVIGCGNISSTYLAVMPTFPVLQVVACADLDEGRARAQAAKFGIPRACSVAELLADPNIDLVVNLTVPGAHYEVALAALEAGKSVYNEKPLALRREEAAHLLELARARGLRVGCAPDTFLGAGLQTCRHLLDTGAIGRPLAAVGFMLSRGPEGWHPDPEFFYKVGGGPLFDMAPYYLTAFIHLLGPVQRVSGAARIGFPTRTVGSGPRRGQTIVVETPTHVVATLEFAGGAVATLITSFDVWAHHLPNLEVYGSDGSLQCPDPNTFGGPVRVWRPDTETWQEKPLLPGPTQNSRGLGVADLAEAILNNRPHRANGEMAYHVLDIMHAILEAAASGSTVTLTTTCSQPAPAFAAPFALR